MKTFINRENFWYRIQQLVILVLHLVLLRWIYFILTTAGMLSATEVLYHFIGIAIMGMILIKGCANWARYHYQKEIKDKKQESV